MKMLNCIVCPKGCRLTVDENNDFSVTGNGCERGAEYGRTELLNPTRVVTSTVRCAGGGIACCPVKTDGAVPKGRIFDVMDALRGVEILAPVTVGQTVIANVCGTGVNVVATRSIK